MKNLKIVESCLVKGAHVEAGTLLKNVDNSTAADLLGNGRAVIVNLIPATATIEHREPVVETRDPKAKGRKAPVKETTPDITPDLAPVEPVDE